MEHGGGWRSVLSHFSQHRTDILFLFILSIIFPSVDVYSDTYLILTLATSQMLPYALWLLVPQVMEVVVMIPQVLNTLFTLQMWWRVEEGLDRRWSWVLVVLQAWPQVWAARIIWRILTGRPWKNMKVTLDTRIGTLEPFIESLPCMYITTTIWHIEVFIFSNSEYESAGGEAGRHSIKYGLFLLALLSSFLATILGISKFLKNGPISIIPASGWVFKAVLVFVSIFSRNFILLMLLNLMLSSRAAEKVLLSLAGIAGKHENTNSLY